MIVLFVNYEYVLIGMTKFNLGATTVKIFKHTGNVLISSEANKARHLIGFILRDYSISNVNGL